MKRGKEEDEKRLEPMFPRLHVKDAYKGGLRAPPRNKMALYEQLSIPSSHMLNNDHGTTSLTSLSNNTTRQLNGAERSLSGQNLDSSVTVNVTDKTVSHMSVVENVRSMEQREQKKRVREEDDFAVPVFINSTRFQCHGRTKSGTETLVRDQVKGSAKPGAYLNSLDMSDTEEMDCNASLRQQESRESLDRNGDETRVKSHLPPEECHSSEDASDDVSDDNSMVDSVDVSPDDVVGVLGQKRFWRARKAIANQQRVFAVQLFELHRLIKVQKLIAASPDLLLDNITYLGKVSAKSYPSKKLLPSSEVISKPPLPHVFDKHNGDFEKANQHNMERSAENVVEKSSNQTHHHQQPSNYTPQPPFISNSSPTSQTVNGCYFPPPPPSGGNQQWLIPVMSPSEGLIYKPHPGMGHTGPACGGYYGHYMPAPMVMGNFMGGGSPQPFHPGVGFASHGNGYFPPYGMIPAMMNPYCSDQQQQQHNQQQYNQQMNQFQDTSGLNNQQQQQQQMNQFQDTSGLNNQQQQQMNQFHKTSGLNNQQQQQMNQFQNTSAPNNQQESYVVNEAATTKQPTKARKSRQGGSTSGTERSSGKNSFRPFSLAAAAADDDDDDGNNNRNKNGGEEEMTTTTTTTTKTTVTQTTRDGGGGGVVRVIKVVPHNNAKLASENAARIFRSIQEERKHYDSLTNLPS
ncbi:unnamed protein product [Cochlearia groenlandica]